MDEGGHHLKKAPNPHPEIHMGHTDTKKYCGDHLATNEYHLSFLYAIPTELCLDLQNVQIL